MHVQNAKLYAPKSVSGLCPYTPSGHMEDTRREYWWCWFQFRSWEPQCLAFVGASDRIKQVTITRHITNIMILQVHVHGPTIAKPDAQNSGIRASPDAQSCGNTSQRNSWFSRMRETFPMCENQSTTVPVIWLVLRPGPYGPSIHRP